MMDLAAAMWIVYDAGRPRCAHNTCAATLRLSAANGAVDWVRPAQGSPCWNF
jgi:hypothetical protein